MQQYAYDPRHTTAFTLDESRTITPYTFLHCYLEFQGLVPIKKDWKEKRLSRNPPKLYRFLQLRAMSRAFGIDEPLSLSTCQFIKEHDLQRYSPATAMISNDKLLFDSEFDLKYCFNQLLSYCEQIEQVLCFGSGACHIGFLLGQGTYQKIWQFSGMIKEKIVDIDKLLVAFISPEGKSFSVEDLIRDYGYPDVNISEIDMEHL